MTDVETPIEAPIDNIRASGNNKRISVIFSKEDVEQEMPSLPVSCLIEEMTSRHGKSPYAGEFIAAVEDADANGDGLISIPELIVVIENLKSTKKQNVSLKKLLGFAAFALLLVLIAIFGLVFAVVKLTQEVSTGGDSGNENALVNKATGHIVDVHPSDGGGIYLDMAAFTEPVNITFPAHADTTLECVGQVSVEQINEHYAQFTQGGSEMTIRYVDFAKEGQPFVYIVIPASSLEVKGHQVNSDAGALAQEATAAIKATQEQVGSPDDRKRRLATATRALAGRSLQKIEKVDGLTVPVGNIIAIQEESNIVSRTGNQDDQITANGKGQASRGKTRRRLQDGTVVMTEEEYEFGQDLLLTVDDKMKAFGAQSVDLTFTKDTSLSDDYYFVCQGVSATVAVN